MNKFLDNKEPKGTQDWLPEEFLIRKYIFDTWRQVCLRYGFQEYLTPLVESAQIYRAKSGEDVGGKELVVFKDLGGRELSIRPEMTPSVTRMVSKIYGKSPKPLKYFSIANFMRNEKPQRGRNREFWQLNVDTFGSESLEADIEIIQLSLDLMLEFNPPKDSFVLSINNRKLIEAVLELAGTKDLKPDEKLKVVRTLDKWKKIDNKDLEKILLETGLEKEGFKVLEKFMKAKNTQDLIKALPELKDSVGLKEIEEAIKRLSDLSYNNWIEFNPTIIRGFDYYDGLVFEVYDKNPKNSRALFGGGRYNGLAQLFGKDNFPAVGVAPGDETIRLFLESWNLLDKVLEKKNILYYFPLLEEGLKEEVSILAKKLRGQGLNVLTGLEPEKLTKALNFANKKKADKVIIFAQKEKKKKIYKIKDMETGKEEVKNSKLS